jgi:hypothetical protein
MSNSFTILLLVLILHDSQWHGKKKLINKFTIYKSVEISCCTCETGVFGLAIIGDSKQLNIVLP